MATITGSNGNDIINGSHGHNNIYGLAGDDIITGSGGGNALIDGGAGNDTITGKGGPDRINGGEGDDTMTGGGGGDYFIFSANSGHDTITDFTAGSDVIDLTAIFSGSFDDLLNLAVDTADGVRIALGADAIAFVAGKNGQLSSTEIALNNANSTASLTLTGISKSSLTEASFPDESLIPVRLNGTDGNDVLTGRNGDDHIRGGDGDDILTGAGGNDHIYGEGGNNTIYGGDGNDVIYGSSGDDIIDGGAGNDQFSSHGGDDLFTGGTGNDTFDLRNYSGTITITDFTAGDGSEDRINLDGQGSGWQSVGIDMPQTFEDLLALMTQVGADTHITFNSDIKVVLQNVNKGDLIAEDFFKYAPDLTQGTDGTDHFYMRNETDDILGGGGGRDYIDGDGGNDTISGGDDRDILWGGRGNDALDGGSGNDKLYGDEGNDTLTGGTGDDQFMFSGAFGTDTVTDFTQGTDILDFSIYDVYDVTLSVVLNDDANGNAVLNVTTDHNNYTGGTLTIEGVSSSELTVDDFTGRIAQNLFGDAGINTITGTSGNDSLYGSTAEDIIDAGAGDDFIQGYGGDNVITGGTGNDTFQLNVQAGITTITDFTAGNASVDRIDLNAFQGMLYDVDIPGSFSALQALMTQVGTDTHITFRSDIKLVLQNVDMNNLIDGDFTNYGPNTQGTDGDDVLNGGYLSVTIDAGAGDDIVNGGEGAATIYGGDGNDIISAGSGGSYVEGGTGNDTITGGERADEIHGGTGTDNIKGGHGNDLLNGGDGADSVLGGTGSDILNGGAGNDWIRGESGDDTLDGGDGRDKLFGEAGNDRLDGGVSNDMMIGGEGDDTYVVDHGSDQVIESADEGTDTVESTIGYTLGDNVENLTLTGTNAIDGTGNSADNVIVGNTADNVIDGGAGNDTMTGGSGADTFVVSADNDADTITDFAVGTDKIDLSAVFGGTFEDLLVLATDTVDGVRIALDTTSINVLAGATEPLTATQQSILDTNAADPNANKLTLTGVSKADLSAADFLGLSVPASAGNDMMAGTINADAMAGLDGDDMLQGGGGDDSLDGGSGNDSLYGGEGDDILVAGDGSDHVQGDTGNDTLNGGAGNDWMLGGAGNDTINGGAGRDRLFGNDGDDILDGGASNDTMTGGLGDDSYVVDHSLDVVAENADEGTDTVTSSISYTLGATLENLTLSGSGDIDGTGNDGVNILTGNDGANTLNGGAGNDQLYGNGGDDTLNAGDGGDHVQGDAGNDTLNGEGGNDWMLGGTGDDTINGGAGRDRLFGHDGNDILDGGISNDTMAGGSGDDTYIVDHSLDAVVENADEGTDTVESAITYTLGDNVENLTLSGSADIDGFGNGTANTLTGNSGDNVLTGNGGMDTLRGLGGNDTLNGGDAYDGLYGGDGDDVLNAGGGSDHVQGDGGNDTLNGDGGNDWMLGGAGADTINGGTGNDRMFGNDGNDRMNGGAGLDQMAGGTGNDVFVYSALSDAGDTVTDFNAADDLFELTALMTAIGYAGSDAVTDGYVGISQSGANTVVQVDSDGGGDSFVTLATLENVAATDIDMGTWTF